MPSWPTSSRPSLTARGVTLVRALERSRPAGERIVDDPYAATFLETPDRVLLEFLRRVPTPSLPGASDGSTTILARHRFIDDHLQAALPDVEQILLLGAGYDSRAYRFAEFIGSRTVFEIDLPAISRRKARIVAAHRDEFSGARPVRVETDFRTATLRGRLTEAGFDPGARSFVVWEGVAMYLPRVAVEQTLLDLRDMCAPGSQIAMDFVPFSGRDPRDVAARIASQSFRLIGEPVRFQLAPAVAPQFLDECGWTVDELLTAPQMTARYATDGRRCFPALYVVSAH